MIRISGIKMPLSYSKQALQEEIIKKLHIGAKDIHKWNVAKRSIDARHGNVLFLFSIDVFLNIDEKSVLKKMSNNNDVRQIEREEYSFPKAKHNEEKRPVIVGSGPAGLFAALVLAESGVKPIVLERGKDIDGRTKDVKEFNLTGKLDAESNIQFGEGGAGTFSDGKLNTGIQNPRIRFVLETFAKYGDAEDILWQARPHAGTDRLYHMVKGIRMHLQELGTEILFETKLTDIKIENGFLTSVLVESKDATNEIPCSNLILATGHSARDTMEMLYGHGLEMQQKPFAVGLRIEHKRRKINESLYGKFADHPALGAADYKLAVHPQNLRGVYTFCMCPGGVVVPASSEEKMIAVNGMSHFSRDAENSNSAVLAGVLPEDFPSSHPLAGFALQRKLESKAYELGGGDYVAPCQKVGDFLEGRKSVNFGEVKPSYARGVNLTCLDECLPNSIYRSLQSGIRMMGRKLKGFDSPDALLTGVESRTSSPVRIVRDETGQSNITGIYPCGEGAGYAGGIVSSAVDGMKMAELLIQNVYL